MSIRIPKDQISQADFLKIRSLLVVKLKPSGVEAKHGAPEEYITCIHLDDNYYYIPFMCCKLMFPQISQKVLSEKPYYTSNIEFKGKLFSEQISTLEEAIPKLAKWNTVTLNCRTGMGKTVMATCLSTKLPGLRIVLLHAIHLISAWHDEFKSTGARVWVVGEWIDQYKKKRNDPAPEFCDVIICMIDRIGQIPQHFLDNLYTLLIDEAHRFPTNHRIKKILTHFHPIYIIILTATVYMSDDGKEFGEYTAINFITGEASYVIRKDYKPFQVVRYQTGLTIDILPTNRRGDPDWAAYIKMIESHPLRMCRMCVLINKTREAGKKVLVIARETETCDNIELILKHAGDSVVTYYGNKKKYDDARVLVSTLAKIKDGFDQKTVAINWDQKRIDLVVLWEPVKKPLALEQAIGRGLRSCNPIFWIMVDNSPIAEKHWKQCLIWFNYIGCAVNVYSEPMIMQNIDLSRCVGLTSANVVMGKSG